MNDEDYIVNSDAIAPPKMKSWLMFPKEPLFPDGFDPGNPKIFKDSIDMPR